MKLHIRHYGRVVKGKKVYYNPELYKKQMESLEGKEFEEVIKEKHKKPSLDQHAYYRGGILGTCIKYPYFEHFDNEDQIHDDFFAPMFLSYSVQVVTPNESYIVKKVRSTADLSKKEYAEFIDRVLTWCGQNEIHILTEEEYDSKFYKTIYKDE